MADEDKNENEDEDDKGTPEGVLALTPVYVDTFYFNWWKDHIRVSFGEKVGGQRRWRAALIMEHRDLKRLIKDLQEIAQDLDNWETRRTNRPVVPTEKEK